jgi:biopolymer transport protein ExbD
MRKRHRHLDFEVNLIPFIDLLSTCICFLLLTAVWINIGAMNVKQAVGGQAFEESTEKKPTMWVLMRESGELAIDTKDSKLDSSLQHLTIPAQDGKPDLAKLSEAVTQIRTLDQRVITALVQPAATSFYEDIIAIMDEVKRVGFVDLGVAPL